MNPNEPLPEELRDYFDEHVYGPVDRTTARWREEDAAQKATTRRAARDEEHQRRLADDA